MIPAERIPNELKITLAAARVNKGLTQNEVAKKMGVSRYTIMSWEKRKTSPSVIQADKLCYLYDRPKDSIIF